MVSYKSQKQWINSFTWVFRWALGEKKTEVFSYIKDRIWERIQTWKGRTLSKAENGILVKNVAQSIPTYVMGLCSLPKDICDNIEKMLNAYWWTISSDSRGLKWMRWSKLCRPKADGGMGFSNL